MTISLKTNFLFFSLLFLEGSFLLIYGISIVYDTTFFSLIDAYQITSVDKTVKYQKSPSTKYYDDAHYNQYPSHNNRKVMGAWTSSSLISNLEHLTSFDQVSGLNELLRQGYEEYFFPMTDYNNHEVAKTTDKLLESADKTSLKIIIILLPPSEGGTKGNYNWHGWIKYFNSLKKEHPTSFQGFTIDDFNWISTRNDTKFRFNIDFMEHSGLAEALKDKRDDVQFNPTIYFEGVKTDILFKKYNKLIDGLNLASACYYNISILDKQIQTMHKIFNNKPIKYIVYPTITYNYTKQNYSPPSDDLVMATLSIAYNNTNGLIIWKDLKNPIVESFWDNKYKYSPHSKTKVIKEIHNNKENNYPNCNNWYKKYNYIYDRWIGPHQDKEMKSNKWKKEAFKIL